MRNSSERKLVVSVQKLRYPFIGRLPLPVSLNFISCSSAEEMIHDAVTQELGRVNVFPVHFHLYHLICGHWAQVIDN